MGKLSKILVIFGIITFTANFILQPLSSPFTLSAAIDTNSIADQDWPTVQLSSNLNVSWEAIKTIPDNNGLLYVLWNEYNQTSNETYLYFCLYDGLTFSAPELIFYIQENVTLDKLRISFDAVFDSLNRLHIVYLLKMDDYQFFHQYYSTGVWSTPILLTVWGQFSLLADNSAKVYIFGVIRSPENAPNVFFRVFSENSWSEAVQLTNYSDIPATSQSIYDLTPSLDRAAERIFIGYNYGKNVYSEEGDQETWAFRYLLREKANWKEHEYKAEYCYEPKSVIDDTGRLHLIYNNGSSSEGYYFNYAVLKNFWKSETSIEIYSASDTEGRTYPLICDMKILGSDIFVAFTNKDLTDDTDINLLHYNASNSWTQIPVNKNDTLYSFLPMVSLTENGTVVVVHMAFTGDFILLASYQNDVFVYSATKAFPGYNIVIALLSMFFILPFASKRKKNK